MKKLIAVFTLCCITTGAFCQDKMNKKMDNKTDKMNKVMDNKTDKMNKKLSNDTGSMNKKTDTLPKKTKPKVKKVITR